MPTFALHPRSRHARSLAARALAAACLGGALVGVIDGASAGTAATPARDLPPGAGFPDDGPSAVVYPPQTIAIDFDHRKHLARAHDLTCTSCHAGALTSTRSADRLLPSPAACDACHGSDHRDALAVRGGDGPQGQCARCHVGYLPENGNNVARSVLPTARLRSNHKVHADRHIGCESCHGAVAAVGLATREQLGRMQGCFGCHDLPGPGRGGASNACPTCHLTRNDGTLQIAFREGPLVPPRWMGSLQHGADFLARHKDVAGQNSQACANCHAESYCVDCHDGRVRPRGVHPNDYLSMHPIEARLDEPHCAGCHQETRFCLPCHQRSGVTWTSSPGSAHAKGRFHPPQRVWTDAPRTMQHHAWEAERNLSACVSCHNERDCAVCHASRGVGGLGASPHPANFAQTCGRAARRNPRPCLVCHTPSDPAFTSCR